MFDEKLPKRILIGAKKSSINEKDWYSGYFVIIEVNVLEISPSGKYLKGSSSNDPSHNKWYDLVNDYEILEILE